MKNCTFNNFLTSFLREERQIKIHLLLQQCHIPHRFIIHYPTEDPCGISKCFLCPKSLSLKCNCYIIFMSSKSIHRTSNKKFSDFMQLLNQHHQIKICEASHFCIILELVAYKLNFLVKQTGICVTKTARNVHFGNMKFTWKK